jgi:hypothetical protein
MHLHFISSLRHKQFTVTSSKEETMDSLNRDTPSTVAPEQAMKEIAALQKEVAQLRDQPEIGHLKAEIESLKEEVKSKSNYSSEMELMKCLLESNIRQAEEKNNEQLLAMKTAMEALNLAQLESQANGELSLLKEELTGIKEKLQQRESEGRSQSELDVLKADVVEQFKLAEGKTKEEMKRMMLSVECMADKQEYLQTQEELEQVKKEIVLVKDQLKETEKASKVRLELTTLKKSLEMELWNSQGMNKQEIKAIKVAIKKMDKKKIEHKNFDELSVVRRDVKALRDEMKAKDGSSGVHDELESLRKKVARVLDAAEGKSKDEILTMKTAVDSLSVHQTNVTDRSEIDEMRAELAGLKQHISNKEAPQDIKEELHALKASLHTEIMEAKQKNREAVEALHSNFNDLKSGEVKVQASAVEALAEELKKLKKEVEEQNTANQALENLQADLADKLETAGSNEEENKDLAVVKKAVDAVAAFSADEDSDILLDEIKSIKGTIKEAEASVKSSKDLQVLKFALEKKLKASEGKSDSQLKEIMDAVENVDMQSLRGTSQAILKTELEATKRFLKARELYSALSQLEVVFKASLPNLTKMEKSKTRRDIIDTKVNVGGQSFEQLQGNLDKVKSIHDELASKTVVKKTKKEKKGLFKIFRAFGSRIRSEKKLTADETSDSESETPLLEAVATSSAEPVSTETTTATEQKSEKKNDGVSVHSTRSYKSATQSKQASIVKKSASTTEKSETKKSITSVRSLISVRSRASATGSKPAAAVEESRDPIEQTLDMELDISPNFESYDKNETPPPVESVDMSDAVSVVSLLSKQFGELVSLSSFVSENPEKEEDGEKEKEEEYENADPEPAADNDPVLGLEQAEVSASASAGAKEKSSNPLLRRVSSKLSLRSASSQKSSRSSKSKKSKSSANVETEKSVISKQAVEEMPQAKVQTPIKIKPGMPPLYPRTPSQAAMSPRALQMLPAHEPDAPKMERDDVDHDQDDMMDRSIISVTMMNQNENGEVEIEIEALEDHVLPLTMSI